MSVWPFSKSLHHLLTSCTVITPPFSQSMVNFNGDNMLFPHTLNHTMKFFTGPSSQWQDHCTTTCMLCLLQVLQPPNNKMLHSDKRHRQGNITQWISPVQYTNSKLCRTFPVLIRVGQCNKNVCFLSKRWTIIPTAFAYTNISLQQTPRMHKLFLSLLRHFTAPINMILWITGKQK
jgi:hypothetical protein